MRSLWPLPSLALPQQVQVCLSSTTSCWGGHHEVREREIWWKLARLFHFQLPPVPIQTGERWHLASVERIIWMKQRVFGFVLMKEVVVHTPEIGCPRWFWCCLSMARGYLLVKRDGGGHSLSCVMDYIGMKQVIEASLIYAKGWWLGRGTCVTAAWLAIPQGMGSCHSEAASTGTCCGTA